jgi:hypothetical protein
VHKRANSAQRTMPSSPTQPNRPRPWSKVEKNLRKLHRNGLQDPRPDELGELVAISRKLSDRDSDWERVIDTLGQAIDACWGGTLGNGPSLRDTVRIWFGLPAIDDPDAPDTRGLTSTRRHKAAWEYWVQPERKAGATPREAETTFRTSKATKRYEAIAKKLVDLEVSAARLTPPPAPPSSEPVEVPPAPSPSAPTGPLHHEGGRSRHWRSVLGRRHKLSRRWVILLVIVVTIGAILVAQAPWSSGGKGGVPPFGAIVNAQTGSWSMNAPKTPVEFPTEVESGQQVIVCDLSSDPGCHDYLHSTLVEPIKVHLGDTLAFAFVLNNGYDNAIPYLRISASSNLAGLSNYTRLPKTGLRGLGRTGVWDALTMVVFVQWPSFGRLGAGPVTIRGAGITGAFLQLPTPGSYTLRYLPGTSTLSLEHPHFFHYLPDGIMGPGIALQDLGEPADCYPCDVKYIRWVRFEARVVPGRSGSGVVR